MKFIIVSDKSKIEDGGWCRQGANSEDDWDEDDNWDYAGGEDRATAMRHRRNQEVLAVGVFAIGLILSVGLVAYLFSLVFD